MEYLMIFVAFLLVILFFVLFRRVVIYEYERGLRYDGGKFKKILLPGSRWHLHFRTRIQKVDIRPRFVTIRGQEVLSSDGVTLKVSLAAKYEICDPNIAINEIQNYEGALYLELQLALREIIGNGTIDDLLEKRNEFSEKLQEVTEAKAQELGLELLSVSIKDIVFPGQLKQIFAQVVNARKEGLASLERARGETAALRNLANAAKMLEQNPTLMQLRLIQSLGESSGNTVVLGMPSGTLPIKTRDMDPSEMKRIGTETS